MTTKKRWLMWARIFKDNSIWVYDFKPDVRYSNFKDKGVVKRVLVIEK